MCNKQPTFVFFAQQIKAEKEPDVPPEILKEETAEWVRSHKDKDGNIPTQWNLPLMRLVHNQTE